MSFKLAQWAYAQNVQKAAEKSVLVFLCFHSQPDGYSWHSYKLIAKSLLVSKSVVRKSVHSLVSNGLMTVNIRLRPNGGQTSNLIRVKPEKFLDPADSRYVIERINPCVVGDYDGRPKIAFQMDQETYQCRFPNVSLWRCLPQKKPY